jgi:hypothetical protein
VTVTALPDESGVCVVKEMVMVVEVWGILSLAAICSNTFDI